ncbi:sacsin N-terminal ATP-binding-like domain-containing protein [Bradyrhizobium sp. AUGA SZCCT0160]|uniref:sacsin N-terminal ATP-binding-like domain-containing protein n=1 Tax=Bradyrhizobium sp. AUGA SZCCT0160 TaxID=2807662 RepID=UPI001BA8A4B2|nr:hypothetical protein [Bradyrhizobium sp. AUGA SZCCT0160]MBR1191475.1 hypothetical protein [Bradyrhizobium sp. AUGA SZCCT0160]
MTVIKQAMAVIGQEQDIIEEVRRDREDLARVLKKHTGIRKIVEDLYPDSAHFIYELLQNAEDTGATDANFILSDTSLIFEHNGRPFEKKDIYGITDIGEGTKGQDDDKIGRFGVGFKAVFAYSETPHIWSPTFSFKIENLVLPTAIKHSHDLGTKTRFEFPFNNPKKPKEKAYADVEGGLRNLAETALLFLSHLQSVGWKTGAGASGQILRIHHSDNHIEVLKESSAEATSSLHFLKFERPVAGLERQRAAVAFALDLLPNVQRFDEKLLLAKQFRIAETRGAVAVYFPAEKETSGLRFHMHAPFVPELSRASIKDTPANAPLFEQLAELTAAALHDIRDHGLLTAEFLAVLPNRHEQIPPRYEAIRQTLIEAMNTKPLTPTHAKGHGPAQHLLQAKASLKDLLAEGDIEYLVDYDNEPPRWAVAATQKNTNIDRFLGSLAIKDWGIEEFVELLTTKVAEGTRYLSHPPYYASEPDQDFMAWLASKPVEWHQQLYALLYTELAPEGDLYRLKDCRIVRRSDGGFSTGDKSFFSSDGVEHDEVLPRVESAVYSSGKSKVQQSNARKFLEEIGVRVVGEAEQVEVILNQRYTQEAEIPDEKTYLKDLKRFIALVEKQPECAKLFNDHYIFECDGDQWCQPSEIYLDQPFLDTGLSAYYAARGQDAKLFALAERYQDCGITAKRLAAFAKAVGAATELKLTHVACYGNPEWPYLRAVGGERSTSPIDRDYTIAALEVLLTTPSLELSRLVWRTMCSLPGDGRYLVATYRRNASSGSRSANSKLVHILRRSAWVPQDNGSFVRPAEASRGLLPNGFAFDPGQAWLKAVRFGEEVTRRSEEQRQKQAIAKELGFADNESLERARRFVALPPEDQERILADQDRRVAVEVPDHEPGNPVRRAEGVAAQAAEAPERITEKRTRSVSLGREAVKEEAAQYLCQQYTSDGDVICQVCKAPMPFKLDDGTAYFEKVEFLPELKKRHYQNYLALCPNHAAMFMEANGSAEFMRDMFVELSGNELEVVLAQKDATIYFTKTHIADLKKVIEVDQAEDALPSHSDE